MDNKMNPLSHPENSAREPIELPPVNLAEQPQPRFDIDIIDESSAARMEPGLRGSWPFGLDAIQPALKSAGYTERAQKALISAFRWSIDPAHPVHIEDFARQIKSSSNTLYKIYLGKYRYQKEEIIRDGKGKEIGRKPHKQAGQIIPLKDELISAIEKWLDIEKKAFAIGANAVVQTPTLQSIVEFCHAVRESHTIGFVVGPSHIGKTWALKDDYTTNNNHGSTAYARLPAAANLREVLCVICEALGVSSKGRQDRMKAAIKKALTKNMLLILDEVHLLAHTAKPKQFFKIVEVIREIHDATKAGIVLSFTILEEVTAAKTKELQQLWRRAPHKLMLPKMPTKEDLTAILEHNGLNFPEPDFKVTLYGSITETPRALVRQLAKDEALLAITERLRLARKKSKGVRITWEHFVEAHLEIASQDMSKDPEWN